MSAPFVLITGGKGGVGKTTLAANLGVTLASQGLRVLLVDLDLGLANVDVLLGLEPRFDVEDALAGRCALAACVVRGPEGLDVLPAGSGTAGMAQLERGRREHLLAGLAELGAQYDIVLGDSAAGIGADVLAFAAHASIVLVVTTPDPTALTDAYGLIKALDALSREQALALPTPELVLNFVSGVEEAEITARKLAEVCERFLSRAPRLAGWLPKSARVLDACRKQRLFALAQGKNGAETLEQRCVRRIAEHVRRLSGTLEAANSR